MSDPSTRANLRFGTVSLCLFLLLGLVLESFHLFKVPLYVDAHLRRELFTLAHAHGTLFGLLNVVFALGATACIKSEAARRRASRLLLTGSVLLPLGFLLGGIANAEGDPSPAIVLVPIGGLLALGGLASLARGAFDSHAD